MNTLVTPRDGVAFEDGADRARILAFGRDTGGRYALMEWTVAPGAVPCPGYAPHRHREIEETFLIRSGELEFLLGDEVVTLRAGDFIRVPPGLRHGYANISGAAVEMLVSFHPGGIEELFLKYRTDGRGLNQAKVSSPTPPACTLRNSKPRRLASRRTPVPESPRRPGPAAPLPGASDRAPRR